MVRWVSGRGAVVGGGMKGGMVRERGREEGEGGEREGGRSPRASLVKSGPAHLTEQPHPEKKSVEIPSF